MINWALAQEPMNVVLSRSMHVNCVNADINYLDHLDLLFDSKCFWEEAMRESVLSKFVSNGKLDRTERNHTLPWLTTHSTYGWFLSVVAAHAPDNKRSSKETSASYFILLLFDLMSSSTSGEVGQERWILGCAQSVLSRVCGWIWAQLHTTDDEKQEAQAVHTFSP